MGPRSHRIPRDLALNDLALAQKRCAPIPFDLTTSNPTICGFSYPERLLEDLSDQRSLVYEPDPRGPEDARQAVAAQYEQWETAVDRERIFLSASTSEAYSFLFRLLCNPGDTVLIPSPSYPLFDHLARLDNVTTREYVLDPDDGWRIDFSTLADDLETVRAVIVVHPNNPTGSFVHPSDRDHLVDLCRRKGWALIADEVFLPYPLDGGPGRGTTFTSVDECLCFTLGGFSKSVGLPQLKLSWIVVNGPTDLVEETSSGLEWITDTYLSTSAPVANAAAQILALGETVHHQISARCTRNLKALRELARSEPAVSVPFVGGGWNAVLRVPAVAKDEELCVRLLEEQGVSLHPGEYFGFPRPGYLVASLLPLERTFHTGIARALPVLAVRPSSDEPPESRPPQPSRTPNGLMMRVLASLDGAAAAAVGIAALAGGMAIARTAEVIHQVWPYLNLFGLTSVSLRVLVVAAFVLGGCGALVLARIASHRIPTLVMMERLPRIVLRWSPRGIVLLSAAAFVLAVLCSIAWIERWLMLYPPLLLTCVLLAWAGIEACGQSVDCKTERPRPDRLNLVFGILVACVVAWTATRGLTHWRFAWVGDEAVFYYAARSIARGFSPSIFNLALVYDTHSVLDSTWQAVFLKIFGEGVISWRLAEVAILTLAAVFAYTVCLGRKDPSTQAPVSADTRLSAIIGALALGCSAYTIAFARIGYNNLHTLVPPLLISLVLIRLGRKPQATTLFALGCAIGLCFYTFLATIVIWIVIAAFAFTGPTLPRSPRERTAAAILLSGLTITLLPLLLSEPSAMLAGLSRSNALGLEETSGQTRSLWLGIARSFAAFWHNIHWFDHYVAGPLLGPIVGALTAVGLAAAWFKRRTSAGDRFLLIWFVLGVVVIALSSDQDRPRLTRLLFVMPPAAILAALGSMVLAEVARTKFRIPRAAVASMMLLAAVAVPVFGLHQLLVVVPERIRPHSHSLTLRALQEHPQSIIIEIAPSAEENRRKMVDMYPWLEDRFRWIAITDLKRQAATLDRRGLLLVYEYEDAVAVDRILPEPWVAHRYPARDVPGAIWLFSTTPRAAESNGPPDHQAVVGAD